MVCRKNGQDRSRIGAQELFWFGPDRLARVPLEPSVIVGAAEINSSGNVPRTSVIFGNGVRTALRASLGSAW